MKRAHPNIPSLQKENAMHLSSSNPLKIDPPWQANSTNLNPRTQADDDNCITARCIWRAYHQQLLLDCGTKDVYYASVPSMETTGI